MHTRDERASDKNKGEKSVLRGIVKIKGMRRDTTRKELYEMGFRCFHRGSWGGYVRIQSVLEIIVQGAGDSKEKGMIFPRAWITCWRFLISSNVLLCKIINKDESWTNSSNVSRRRHVEFIYCSWYDSI